MKSSHICEYTRKRAHQLGIDLIFLPSGSPHLNPIGQVWKQLKWTMAPIIVDNEDEFQNSSRTCSNKLHDESATPNSGVRSSFTFRSCRSY